MLSKQELCKLFTYSNGNLFWNESRGNVKKGKIAGVLNSSEYIQTRINGKLYMNHRIVFVMHYGYLPKCIDHIDGNKTNNRIENLREATKSQNQFNQKLSKNNTSGAKGVSWNKASGKWRVDVVVNGKQHYFGVHKDLEFAELVAVEARNKLHKGFARHA